LVGISECPDDLVIDLGAGGRDHQSPMLFDEVIAGQRFDSQTAPISDDFHLARPEPETVAEWLWNNQSPCLINGCSHTKRLPSKRES
jgi:hypothetical protein